MGKAKVSSEVEKAQEKIKALKRTIADKESKLFQERQKLGPLEAEVSQLQAQVREVEKLIRSQAALVIAEHLDGLLAAVPEHEFRDCSDDQQRDDSECSRCALLYLKENTWDIESYEFKISISHRER
jgi:chromosome segregation ATPase